MNLILNGIEAMKDAKGELTVTSKRTDDVQLLISVSDSGLGLPVGEVDRIFDAFFTTKEQGTGMGLSISRRIIGLTEAICGRAPIRDAARHFSSHCLPTCRRIRYRPRNSATVDEHNQMLDSMALLSAESSNLSKI
jgi:nitrogen fixation/metabolism regulation signal transduction histidine kinase